MRSLGSESARLPTAPRGWLAVNTCTTEYWHSAGQYKCSAAQSNHRSKAQLSSERHSSALARIGSRPHAQQEGVVKELAARAAPAEDEDAASARDRRVAAVHGRVLAAHREAASPPPPPLQVEAVQRRVGRVGHVVDAAEYNKPVAEGYERVGMARGRRAPPCADHLRPRACAQGVSP